MPAPSINEKVRAMFSLRSLLLAPAALAACAFAAPVASADVDRRDYTYDYAATIETSVDYNSARTGTNDLGVWSSQFDDEFTIKTEVPLIRFISGFPSHNNPAYSTATAQRGHLLLTPAGSGGPITCSGTGVEDLAGGSVMGVLSADVRQFKVRVLSGVTRRLDQCSGVFPDFLWRYDALGAPMGESPFDATVSFPGARLGQDHIQDLSGEVSGTKCPGYDEDTTVCVLSWTAKVTFRLLNAVKTPDPGELTPADLPMPGEKTEPLPRPVPKTKAYTVDAATLDANAGTVTANVQCASACSGVATANLPSAKARAAAAKKPKAKSRALATTKFRAAAGKTAKVVLRIPKAKRAAVRKAGSLKVTLVVTPQGGKPTTQTLVVKPRKTKR